MIVICAALLAAHTYGSEICANGLDVAYAACLSDIDPVTSCERRLEANERDFNSRLSLCEAFVQLGRHDAAVETLKAAASIHRDNYTRGLIDLAVSNVEENEGLPKREAGVDTLAAYHTMRCSRLKKMSDCEIALELAPDAIEAWRGKAAIHAEDNATVDAIRAYRRVIEIESDDESRARLAGLEQDRRAIAETCLTGNGAAALSACAAARLPGDPDDRDLLIRAGDIAWSMGRFPESERAFREASYTSAGADSVVDDRITGIENTVRCLEADDAGSCARALRVVSSIDSSNRMEFMLNRRACQLSVAASTEAARSFCDAALRKSPGRAETAEIEELIAQGSGESLERCRRLGAGDDIGAILDACETALATVSDPQIRKELETIIETWQSRDLEMTCLDLAASADPSAQERCTQALARAPVDGRADIERALRALASTDALETCKAAENANDPAAASEICGRLAQRSDIGVAARAQIDAIVKTLDARTAVDKCLGAVDPDLDRSIQNCELALRDAPQDERAELEARVEALAADRSEQIAVIEREQLRDRCFDFTGDPAEGIEICTRAARDFPGNSGIDAMIARLEKLSAPYSNEPLTEVAGFQAITY